MRSQLDLKSAQNRTLGRLAGRRCPWTNALGAAVLSNSTQRLPGSPLDLAAQVDFQPDAVQTEILLCQDKQILLLMGRQCGKSTVVALKALHLALTKPGSQILTAGSIERQSGEFLLKVREFLQVLKINVKGDGVNPNSMVLPNGSRFIPVPGNQTGNRGYSKIRMLIIDEASYASDELYYALRPMTATTNGTVILLGTANGRKGFFYDEWSKMDDGWARFQKISTDCPRIDPDFLRRERASLPDHCFRQEYLCEFIDGAGSLFRTDTLRACLNPNFQARDL